ncbi:hypothetical protein AB0G79_20195 [Streptomyces sp. NPDC020807]|uniref:hypothetical protein n=1 Tax=Streptomyces sp. NPDC020807 TaxID=3155119 RepID=UPI0033CC6750
MELVAAAQSQGWMLNTTGVERDEYGAPSLSVRLMAHTSAGDRDYLLTWEQTRGRLGFKADRSCAYHLSGKTAKQGFRPKLSDVLADIRSCAAIEPEPESVADEIPVRTAAQWNGLPERKEEQATSEPRRTPYVSDDVREAFTSEDGGLSFSLFRLPDDCASPEILAKHEKTRTAMAKAVVKRDKGKPEWKPFGKGQLKLKPRTAPKTDRTPADVLKAWGDEVMYECACNHCGEFDCTCVRDVVSAVLANNGGPVVDAESVARGRERISGQNENIARHECADQIALGEDVPVVAEGIAETPELSTPFERHPALVGPLPFSPEQQITELEPGYERVVQWGDEWRIRTERGRVVELYHAAYGDGEKDVTREHALENVIPCGAFGRIPKTALELVGLYDTTKVRCAKCEPGWQWGRGETPKLRVRVGGHDVAVCNGAFHGGVLDLVPAEYTDGLNVDKANAALVQYARWIGGGGVRPLTRAEREAQAEAKAAGRAPKVKPQAGEQPRGKLAPVELEMPKDAKGRGAATFDGRVFRVVKLAGKYSVYHGDAEVCTGLSWPNAKHAIRAWAPVAGEEQPESVTVPEGWGDFKPGELVIVAGLDDRQQIVCKGQNHSEWQVIPLGGGDRRDVHERDVTRVEDNPWNLPLDAKGKPLLPGDLIMSGFFEQITPYTVERIYEHGNMSVMGVRTDKNGKRQTLPEHCQRVVKVTQEQVDALAKPVGLEVGDHRGGIFPGNPIIKPGLFRATCSCQGGLELIDPAHSRKVWWFKTQAEAEAAWYAHAAESVEVVEPEPEEQPGYVVQQPHPDGENTESEPESTAVRYEPRPRALRWELRHTKEVLAAAGHHDNDQDTTKPDGFFVLNDPSQAVNVVPVLNNDPRRPRKLADRKRWDEALAEFAEVLRDAGFTDVSTNLHRVRGFAPVPAEPQTIARVRDVNDWVRHPNGYRLRAVTFDGYPEIECRIGFHPAGVGASSFHLQDHEQNAVPSQAGETLTESVERLCDWYGLPEPFQVVYEKTDAAEEKVQPPAGGQPAREGETTGTWVQKGARRVFVIDRPGNAIQERFGTDWEPLEVSADPEFTEETEEPQTSGQGPLTRQQRRAAWRMAAGESRPMPGEVVSVGGRRGAVRSVNPLKKVPTLLVAWEDGGTQNVKYADLDAVTAETVKQRCPKCRCRELVGTRCHGCGHELVVCGRPVTLGVPRRIVAEELPPVPVCEALETYVVPEVPKLVVCGGVVALTVPKRPVDPRVAWAEYERPAVEEKPVDPRVSWMDYPQPEPGAVDVLAELRAEVAALREDVESWGTEVAALAVAEAERVVAEVARDLRTAEILELREEARAVREELGWGPVAWEAVPTRRRGRTALTVTAGVAAYWAAAWAESINAIAPRR